MKAILTSLDTKLVSLKKEMDKACRIKFIFLKVEQRDNLSKAKRNAFMFRTWTTLVIQRGNNKIWYPL